MKITRRQLNLSMAAVAVQAACGDDDSGGGGGAGVGGGGGAGGGGGGGPEPEPWDAPGSEDTAAFAWGVQIGDATASAAMVAMHTLEPSVSLVMMEGTADGWQEVLRDDGLASVDGVVALEVDGLVADTTYALAFYAADGQRRSAVTRFRSALAAGTSRSLRFGASNCLGGHEPWPTLSQAAAERFDFFLMLGDTIYADLPPDLFQYEQKWQTALSTQGLKDLSATTSYIATWDDHEVDNNWSWNTPGIETQVDEALTAYLRGMPQRPGPGGFGLWRKLSWGTAADLFVLDCRGERRDGNYISPEQMDWLKAELSASTARFKFILNSVPVIDFTGTLIGDIQAEDRWQGFPAQRSEIVGHIASEAIAGVLWISGDFHVGGIAYVDPAGGPGENQIEVLTGPGGTDINPGAGLLNPDGRILSIIPTWSYTLFEANPDTGAVRVVFVDDGGATLEEHTLQL